MKKQPRFVKGKIYKAVQAYDPEAPKFSYYKPHYTGDYEICDCWVCDKNGRIHPGYNVCPVPVHYSNLIR